MLKIIPVKCANCGANLEITPEMNQFSCGYCGASQIVERSGGTISLRLLTDSISRVQAGTDKTAAELAIKRLKGELQELAQDRYNLRVYDQNATDQETNRFTKIWIVISLFCLFFGVITGGWFATFIFIVWIASSGTLLFFLFKRRAESEGRYATTQHQLFLQETEIQRRIEENMRIVDG